VSKPHAPIFDTINGEFWEDLGWDDVHLGYQINSKGFFFHTSELSFDFNHMTMHSEPWNGSANRFNSQIIHYAGRGIFDRDVSSRVEQIRKDIKLLWN